jgi:hypothetical protein
MRRGSRTSSSIRTSCDLLSSGGADHRLNAVHGDRCRSALRATGELKAMARHIDPHRRALRQLSDPKVSSTKIKNTLLFIKRKTAVSSFHALAPQIVALRATHVPPLARTRSGDCY